MGVKDTARWLPPVPPSRAAAGSWISAGGGAEGWELLNRMGTSSATAEPSVPQPRTFGYVSRDQHVTDQSGPTVETTDAEVPGAEQGLGVLLTWIFKAVCLPHEPHLTL